MEIITHTHTHTSNYLSTLLEKMDNVLGRTDGRIEDYLQILQQLSNELKDFCSQPVTGKAQIANSFKLFQVYLKYKMLNSDGIKSEYLTLLHVCVMQLA